jgi:hypothetical protein
VGIDHAIRQFMYQAALQAEIDPDMLSFVHSLRVGRRQAGFPPDSLLRASVTP